MATVLDEGQQAMHVACKIQNNIKGYDDDNDEICYDDKDTDNDDNDNDNDGIGNDGDSCKIDSQLFGNSYEFLGIPRNSK